MNVILGIGVVFELPVLIFFLTLAADRLAAIPVFAFALCGSRQSSSWRP